MSKKKQAIRFIRNLAIGTVVLVVIAVGAGIGYTWYVGQQKPTALPVEEATPEAKPVTFDRPNTDPKAPESASVQSLTSPVTPGDNALIAIKTNPGSWCTIKAVYNDVPSKDSGLYGKAADEYGSVSWTWTVESSVPTGKWPVTVTCVRNDKSAVVVGDLVVANQTNS